METDLIVPVLGSSRNTPAPDEDTIVKIQALSAGSLNSSTSIVSNTIESLLDSNQSKTEMLESQGDNPRRKEMGRLQHRICKKYPRCDEVDLAETGRINYATN